MREKVSPSPVRDSEVGCFQGLEFPCFDVRLAGIGLSVYLEPIELQSFESRKHCNSPERSQVRSK